jgi:hypothetical protein
MLASMATLLDPLDDYAFFFHSLVISSRSMKVGLSSFGMALLADSRVV